MMNNKTGVVMIYVDVNNNYYARYEGYAGRTVKCSNAWKAEQPLTQHEVEMLRNVPENFLPPPEEPKVA